MRFYKNFYTLIPSSISFEDTDTQQGVKLVPKLKLLQTSEENAIKYMMKHILEFIPEAEILSFKFEYVVQNNEIKTYIVNKEYDS